MSSEGKPDSALPPVLEYESTTPKCRPELDRWIISGSLLFGSVGVVTMLGWTYAMVTGDEAGFGAPVTACLFLAGTYNVLVKRSPRAAHVIASISAIFGVLVVIRFLADGQILPALGIGAVCAHIFVTHWRWGSKHMPAKPLTGRLLQ